MNTVFLLIGGNIEDRYKHLGKAVELISQQIGKIENVSAVYETAAWGIQEQADYLNQAIQVNTYLTPQELMKAARSIETNMGRERRVVWGPRIIDVDILFYNQEVIQEEKLFIPHPHLHERRFVLTPLEEIAPDLQHPVLKKTIRELLDACPDPLWVRKFSYGAAVGG
ncbi:2-amino-4-hydroxy-6-hydroxymethyldihydropteridine diphosphokinase [Compostibacter hankyongensis]|uniref:2-amino-4-hydroxy-6-hydroxymethyldihydropteridine pyrophosphokinase n=1 Tax=Compostibacter hankyongensis TaxID=1007089 RepID=A0ABP8FR07_9BACT